MAKPVHHVQFDILLLALTVLQRRQANTMSYTRSYKRRHSLPLAVLAALSATLAVAAKVAKQAPRDIPSGMLMWQEPADIASRDLFYGPGGEKDAPRGTFTFEKEDLDGTNPKFVVRDQDGVKWKVKLGEEARPETVASRLVWAAGFFADEDYFLADFKAEGMPEHLHRGAQQFAADGSTHNVRLKRYLKGEEKIGSWEWLADPFTGSREWNGLRVLMALIDNWDLKDINNAIYDRAGTRIYLVSDLGASFGTTGRSLTRAESKGNLSAYEQGHFITRTTPESVDFRTPSRPALIHMFELPEYVQRVHMEWIGKNIPRADARWMGEVLAKLSPEQIRAAFRAAGYTPEQVDAFSAEVEKRIAALNQL